MTEILDRLKQIVRRCPSAERAARFLYDRRFQTARKYLRGCGVEIGALDRPLYLPNRARAFYLDRIHPRELRRHYPELDSRPLYVSFVADGESMDCVRDGSLDFIAANHVIEHCEDPIATLMTFARKLSPGGVVFMAVPDKRRTFDRDRSETGWEHLADDHRRGAEHSRAQHYREWTELVEHLSGNEAARRADELATMGYRIHFHCWSDFAFRDFLDHAREFAPLALLDRRSWRDENIYILRREYAAATGMRL